MKLNAIGPNQTEVAVGNRTVFFSYNTPVAARIGRCYYKTEKKWSKTTSAHVSKWLGNNTAIPMSQEWFDALPNTKA